MAEPLKVTWSTQFLRSDDHLGYSRSIMGAFESGKIREDGVFKKTLRSFTQIQLIAGHLIAAGEAVYEL